MARRLAAILTVDMVGSSRLMREDEAGTRAAYQRHCRELITPRAAQYHGRIWKLTGDGVLMEFASVVDAVRFAVEVQLALHEENASLPSDKQFCYRIGINIGDIIEEEGDVYGDDVNIAARLQELADPGGICLSRTAFNQMKCKLDLTFECLGEKQVKNIAEPVTVCRVLLDGKAEALATPIIPDTPTLPKAPTKSFLPSRFCSFNMFGKSIEIGTTDAQLTAIGPPVQLNETRNGSSQVETNTYIRLSFIKDDGGSFPIKLTNMLPTGAEGDRFTVLWVLINGTTEFLYSFVNHSTREWANIQPMKKLCKALWLHSLSSASRLVLGGIIAAVGVATLGAIAFFDSTPVLLGLAVVAGPAIAVQ
jgi:class 3 adenylate cyclase